MTLFVRPRRVAKVATIPKPATLLRFHKALVDRKFRRLLSSVGIRRKPGAKGPTQEIISAIVEIKLRNPRFGYQRIAEQNDKDIVRRVLSTHYRPDHPDRTGYAPQISDSLIDASIGSGTGGHRGMIVRWRFPES